MGLIQAPEEAASRQHTPKVAFVAKPREYVSSSGKKIGAGDIDADTVRIGCEAIETVGVI